MIHRVSHLFAALATLLLVSCSADTGQGGIVHYQSIDKPSIRMAGARSINPQILDANLAHLIKETQLVEQQIDHLRNKLEQLREQINAKEEKTPSLASIIDQPAAMDFPHPILPIEKQSTPPVKPKTVHAGKKPSVKPSKNTTHKKPSRNKGVINIRTGVHKDKTRLVFDIYGSTSHKVDFDKEAQVLTISLPKTKWATRTGQLYNFSQLLGYQAKDSGQGSIVAFSVKNTSRVKYSQIGATGGKPARLVIDLFK